MLFYTIVCVSFAILNRPSTPIGIISSNGHPVHWNSNFTNNYKEMANWIKNEIL